MKRMTCKQLGGACEKEFYASSFEEIAALSKKHGIEMHNQGDRAHLEAMESMQHLMQSPGAMQEWMEAKRSEFAALPEFPRI